MQFKIKNYKKTCESSPAQWEGETEDGMFVYIRFRWNTLDIEISKTKQRWEQNKFRQILSLNLPNENDDMSCLRMRNLTSSVFNWPRENSAKDFS